MSNYKIKCTTYGGKIGWFLRKHFSQYTSYAYLKLQFALRRKLYKNYIKLFNQRAAENNCFLPCLISVETINRCNSSCSFCPANIKNEARPFQKMDEALFKKIIAELKELNYSGYLNLYVNNEPFMDKRIEDWYRYAKEQLPQAKMLLYTNGTLLTEERFRKIIPYIDKMIINNYTTTMSLHENVQKLFDFVKNTKEYQDKDITIQIRYINEILTNRSGAAPNKKELMYNNEICIMPFTDFTIYPNGNVGLCCSDATEKTCLGNIKNETIFSVWTGKTYQNLREKIAGGRSNYPFCKGCDFVDAGIRNMFIKQQLK